MKSLLLVFLTFSVLVSGTVEPVSAAVVPAARSAADPPAPARPIPHTEYPGWDGETGAGEAIDPRFRKLVVDIAQLSEDFELRDAATAALAVGTEDAIFEFLDVGEPEAKARAEARKAETARQNRETIRALAGTGGPVFNAEVQRVLAGSDYDRAAFLDYGRGLANDRDQRLTQAAQARAEELRTRVAALIGAGGPEVQRGAQEALAAGDAAISAFLDGGYLAAAKRDAVAREAYLKDLEARTKAAEQLSDLAKKAARATQARKNLLIAHGRGIRSLQRAANAMVSAGNAGRQAAQILAANNAGGHHSPESFSLVRQEAARQVEFASQAATEAQNASVAANAEAAILVEVGLPYGADWAQMARGMAEAARGAVLAGQTAQHAIDATMATDAARDDQAKAEARAEQARQWQLHAKENARAAAALAVAAQTQALAAQAAVPRAQQARDAAIKARDDAWDALGRTRAASWTAEAERDKAAAARRTAEEERDKAARFRRDADARAAEAKAARADADAQARIAADARHRAEAQEAIARGAESVAVREEGNAETARRLAWEAQGRADAAEARAQALAAAAAAARGTDQEAPAWAAANEARDDAVEAANAARGARDAANKATGFAAQARESATQSTYAAAASRAAAEDAAVHAANADVAASTAEQAAAEVHISATKANSEAAKATAAEVQAATAARTAVQLAEQAGEQARLAAVVSVRSRDEADAANAEAVSAATQASLATRASLAARSSSAAITDPTNTAITVVAPFVGTDLNADFVTEVAQQALAVGAEQAQAAQDRANEAQAAATAAQQAADSASVEAKAAFQAAAEAAKSAGAAAKSAATAQAAARDASTAAGGARSAATIANSYDEQAHGLALTARNAANQANQDAAIAGLAADAAEAQALAARNAATAAEADALAAQASADRAERDATEAAKSAERARIHAQNTSTAAANARAAAADAQKAADLAEVAQRQREAEERGRQAQLLAGCLPTLSLDDADLLDADDTEGPATFGEYQTIQGECANGGDVTSFLFEVGGQLLLDYIGVEDFRRCFGDGNVGACLWSVLDAVGWILPVLKGKAIYKAIAAVVLNIGKYLGKSERIAAISAKLLRFFERYRLDCVLELATSGFASAAGASTAAAAGKVCKVPRFTRINDGNYLPQFKHALEKHGTEWWGRAVDMKVGSKDWLEFEAMIDRGANSAKIVPWSSGSSPTYAFINRFGNDDFVVQIDRVTGYFVTAFRPTAKQLRAMWKLYRE